jgi:hypothetical protein
MKAGPPKISKGSRLEYTPEGFTSAVIEKSGREQQPTGYIRVPQPQQGPSIDDYNAYRQQMEADAQATVQRSMAQTGPQWAADNAMVVSNAAKQVDQPSAPFPEKYGDWSFWDKVRNPFTEGGEDAYRKARDAERIGLDETTPAQTVIEGVPANVPVPTPRPLGMDENTPMQTIIPDQEGNALPVDPIEEIRRQKAMVDSIYPQLPPQDIGQDAIEQEISADRQRANYLAQLAFFSGITQSAGGQWEGVGRGLAGAGQAYTAGFDRYQKALNRKADRMQDTANMKYKSDVASTDAAVKLYGDAQDRKKGEMSEARLRNKERQSDIDEYFKQRLGLAKGDDFNPTDQNAVDRILRDWRISRDRGEIVATEDVSDK